MNKVKMIKFYQNLFLVQIFLQAVVLISVIFAPVKLVSITNSIIYMLLYIAIYKVVIKKSNLRTLVILNVLLNKLPYVYMYLKICIYYNSSLSKMNPIIFTSLLLLVIIVIDKYRRSLQGKQNNNGKVMTSINQPSLILKQGKVKFNWKPLSVIIVVVSQLMLYTVESYTMIMYIYISIVALAVVSDRCKFLQ